MGVGEIFSLEITVIGKQNGGNLRFSLFFGRRVRRAA